MVASSGDIGRPGYERDPGTFAPFLWGTYIETLRLLRGSINMAVIRGISARAKSNEKNWHNRERSVPEPMGTAGLLKLCFSWFITMLRKIM